MTGPRHSHGTGAADFGTRRLGQCNDTISIRAARYVLSAATLAAAFFALSARPAHAQSDACHETIEGSMTFPGGFMATSLPIRRSQAMANTRLARE